MCVGLLIASCLSYSLRSTPTKRPANNTIHTYNMRYRVSYEYWFLYYSMIYAYNWFITFILCFYIYI